MEARPIPAHPAEVPAGTGAARQAALPPLRPCKHRAQGQNGHCIPFTTSTPAPGLSPAPEATMEQDSKTHDPCISPGWVLLGEGCPHVCWRCLTGTHSVRGAESPGFFLVLFTPNHD